ncbi:glycosyltransferase family 4 protein [Azospirillum rugosum]|uniref:Glycosyltransferase involved in cell wall biosynthesis n=1 Tax=Azospirillum rugosum TaxID=416170 RepID=A0ABS4SQD8_9PROT|nr:glycosyltransferase family 4 protein [Azospirillum rugosum]MBP2294323.1 glycosyltransferase involved in cell wall biosynthesis [Azospirillum rugosum]MDQ0527658.1 glycosyltransferase involved in cell wall biosynthesis [Azospirillum rugosum]
MTQPLPFDEDALARFEAADVIFLAQDGFRQPSARVRCYNFAKALRQQGLRAEVLSFFDHLGAPDQGGALSTIPEEEKIRLNLEAHRILARNPRAVLYVQKVGYHTLAAALAAERGGNRIVLDYDDYELDMQPYRRLEPWFPSLRPDQLFPTVANRAGACIAASHRLQDLLAPLNPNTHLVHTVADQDLFTADGREAPRRRFGGQVNGRVNILYSGDFWGDIPMKDVLFAVDAFALVPRAVRDRACFHIIGFGRAWGELKLRVRERYPDLPNIELHEFIPPAEIPAVLREMDIGVLPYSQNEFNVAKSPTKMFEFLLAKVAVCATPVGEVTHCLEDGVSGLLAEGMEGYSAALARLIGDDAFRRGVAEEAHRVALERFSLQGVAPRLAAVIRALLRPEEKAAPAETTLEDFLTARLGRPLPIAPREAHLLRRDLAALLAAEDPAAGDPRRWTEPLVAALDWPGLTGVDGVPAERVAALKGVAARHRNAARLRPEIALPARPRPAGPPALSKLAAAEDWDDPSWRPWVVRVRTNVATFQVPYIDDADAERRRDEDARNSIDNFFKRSRGAWERAQYLYGLDRLGLLEREPRALVVSAEIDGFYLLLTELARAVGVLDVGADAPRHAERVARGDLDPWLAKPRRFRRDRIAIHHGDPGPDLFAGTPWDVAILPQNTLPRLAAEGKAAEALAWIDRRLAPGGVLAFSAEVLLNDRTGVPGLSAAQADALGEAFAATGLDLSGPPDLSLSDATLDRFVTTGAAGAENPNFVTRTGETLHAPAVWFGRKRADTPESGWGRLAGFLA